MDHVKKKTSPSDNIQSEIFRRLSVLVIPVLIARKRLLLFKTQIIKGGGHWCDVEHVKTGKEKPTHIVVEDSCAQDAKSLQKALIGLEIKNCPIISTRWLSDSIKLKKVQETALYELSHAHTEDTSSSNELIEVSGRKKLKRDDNCEVRDEVLSSAEKQSMKSLDITVRKFACSQSSSTLNNIPEANVIIITELQKLADAFRIKGDTWRSHGYSKAISAIKRCGKEIKSYEDAVSLEGVGHKIASKVWEILETGSSRKVSEICDDHKTGVLEIFTKIWGVGPSTAESWFQQGCHSLQDVEEKIVLSKQQKIGLKYYNDFQERIPRHEVEAIFQMVTKAAHSIEHSLTTTLVGSYRRGKPSCGDIDVLICKPDSLKAKDLLSQIITCLKETGLVTDDLVSLEVNGNQRKYLGVCRLPGTQQKFRRLDVFVVPSSEFATALMHYTGSALFNRSIRLLAAKKGMSLSEHALHAGIVREGMTVLNEGYIIPTPTEEAIFKALNMDYKSPEERDH